MVIVRPFVAVTGDGQRSGFVVTGVVTDVKKQLLPGVTVKVANTTVGTATNNAGQFVLRLPITKGSLEFSFVGFKSQTINFTENTKDTIRVEFPKFSRDCVSSKRFRCKTCRGKSGQRYPG